MMVVMGVNRTEIGPTDSLQSYRSAIQKPGARMTCQLSRGLDGRRGRPRTVIPQALVLPAGVHDSHVHLLAVGSAIGHPVAMEHKCDVWWGGLGVHLCVRDLGGQVVERRGLPTDHDFLRAWGTPDNHHTGTMDGLPEADGRTGRSI